MDQPSSAHREPFTSLSVSSWHGNPRTDAAAWLDREEVILPGHFPGLIATLAEALADAAAFWTCDDCAGKDERCRDCHSNPAKADAYRAVGEALSKAQQR